MPAYTQLATQDPDSTPRQMTVSPDRVVMQRQGRPSHLAALLLHVVLKGVSVVIYLFGWLFTSSFITTFITILLLLSADFWIVKNISGRLLAGMRWWNYVDDEGQTTWKFERWSRAEREVSNQHESRLFWGALIGNQIIWSLFTTICLFWFHLKWMLLCLVAVVLNGSNLIGYTRCRYDETSVKQSILSFLSANILRKPPANN